MAEVQTTGHAYDGIEEYDNPLPGWWKWMFVTSIIFSVCYAAYFHIGAPGRGITDQYGRELAANARIKFGKIGDLEPNGENVAKYMNVPEWVAFGENVFQTHCIQCHGRAGQGNVGPNLTDELYKHVKDLDSMARVVLEGAANNAMPAWANRLHQNEVVMVSAYVASLRGTNVSGGKAAEGREIPPWPKPKVSAETPSNSESLEPSDGANDSQATGA